MDRLKEFWDVTVFYVVLYASYIWEGIVFVFNKLCLYIQTAIIPALPTAMKVFSNKTANKVIFFMVLGLFFVINTVTFIMFARDKSKAKRQKNRISEKKLLKICFWGGAVGGFLGMLIFNHKTKKKRFYVFIPFMFVIQVILESFLIGFLGFWGFFY